MPMLYEIGKREAMSASPINFTLPLPPSANRYWRHCRGMTFLSPEAKAYKQLVAATLARGRIQPLVGEVAVGVVVHRKIKSGDLDNFLKVLFDSPNTPFLALAVLLAVVGPIATLIEEPPVYEGHVSGAEVRKVFHLPMARAGIIIGLGFAAIIGTFDAVASRFLKDLGGTDNELTFVLIALFVPLVLAMPLAGRFVDHVGPVRAGSWALLAGSPLVIAFGVTRHLAVVAILGATVALIYSVVYTAGQAAVAGATVPTGLTGAGQGAYEATYAVGSMIAAGLSPLIYRTTNAFPMWVVVAALGLTAAAAAWSTAGRSRSERVHLADLESHELDPQVR